MADVTLRPRGAPAAAATDCSTCDLLLPLSGAWTAYLTQAEGDTAPAGPVTLSFHGIELAGTILRAGVAEGLVSAVVVGGNGGLARELPPKAYQQAPVRLPLQELVAAAGEQLAPASTPAVLQRSLPAWVRRRAEAGRSLDHLAEAAGALWRVQPDGAVWVGLDTWPQTPPFEYQTIHQDPQADREDLQPLTAGVLPGQLFGGRKVGTVFYRSSPDALKCAVWYLQDAAPAGEGPLYAGLAGLIREVMRGVDWLALYPARVLLQRADGSLDLVPDSSRLPPLTAVPLRVAVPGARVTVPAGARVLLGFESGDPTRPAAGLFEGGDAQRAAARVDDAVDIGVLQINTVAPGAIAGTYTPPGGQPIAWSIGQPIQLRGKITTGSSRLALP